MTTTAAATAASGLPASVFMLYAPPKRGKTVALLRAFPNAVCIGERSAIELVAENVCGFKPLWIVENVRTIPQLIGWLDGMVKEGHHKRWPQLIIDDFSHIADSSMSAWAAENPRDRYWPFRQLDTALDTLALRIRETGMLCGMSAHCTSPNAEKKKVGGPTVPSDNQTQTMPGWADFVGRIGIDAAYPDPLWKTVITVDQGDESWVTGDRLNVAWASTPPNLREILRAARSPHALPRAAGLEWQDDWAEAVAQRFLKDEPPFAIAEDMFSRCGAEPGSPREMQVLWAYQDGIARGVLRRAVSGGVLGRMKALQARASAMALPPPAAAASTPAAR